MFKKCLQITEASFRLKPTDIFFGFIAEKMSVVVFQAAWKIQAQFQPTNGAYRHTRLAKPAYFTKKRYRKVTIWPRVQVALGLKVVSLVPLVTPLATAHMTASP